MASVKVALAEVGTAAAALPTGRRPPSIGFVAALARLLQESAQGKAALRTRLQVVPLSTHFAASLHPAALLQRLVLQDHGPGHCSRTVRGGGLKPCRPYPAGQGFSARQEKMLVWLLAQQVGVAASHALAVGRSARRKPSLQVCDCVKPLRAQLLLRRRRPRGRNSLGARTARSRGCWQSRKASWRVRGRSAPRQAGGISVPMGRGPWDWARGAGSPRAASSAGVTCCCCCRTCRAST